MKHLAVFRGVPIPIDYASTQTYALLAKRDGGKTYTTLLFEEQLCDAGLFFVTLDPVGKHWALRAGADGSERGGKRGVWVLGGLHGDVPLEPTSGALIADVVVDHPGQYVLDVSTFETDADQDRFALAFAQRLFRRKAKDPGFPLTLILEEAEAFIPERYTSGQQKMLGAFGRIMRQGRNHGLGMWMVAQRPQALNKGVLSQAEVLIVKQMAHPRDLDAVEAWVKANGTPEERSEMMRSVASLEQNEAYVWSPAWLRTFARTTVPRRVTFDSSASVKGGQEMPHVELVPLDVDALGKQIATTAERAKAEDPRELRKTIAQLRRELEQRPTEKEIETVTETVEVPVLANGTVDQLSEVVASLSDLATAAGQAAAEIRSELQRVAKPPARGAAAPPRQQASPRPPSTPPAPRAAPAPTPAAEDDVHVTPAQQRILNALAMLEAIGATQPSKTQLALFAGASPTSGSYGQNLGMLRSAGLVDYPAPGAAALTREGRALADQTQAPSSHDEMMSFVRGLVGPAKARIVDALVDIYPEALPKDDLADRVGASPTSGSFGQNLGSLRSLGLIDYPAPGYAAATAVLFVESVAA